MIIGAHVMLFSEDAEADRAFLRDVLGFRSVDAGGGWLIFKLPPAEVALHPAEGGDGVKHPEGAGMLGASLYLMCDDLKAHMKILDGKNVTCTKASTERWGNKTTIKLPSGGEIGLYQPRHKTALDLDTD
jgi:catechol 2,3-dioxygenase-like lactoylglutathione lyase family enzyme